MLDLIWKWFAQLFHFVVFEGYTQGFFWVTQYFIQSGSNFYFIFNILYGRLIYNESNLRLF